MKIHLLIGQRKQRYEGEYGLEALACMTEHDHEENPDYLPQEQQKTSAGGEFDRVGIVTLSASEKEIRAILYPENRPIPAEVQAG